MSRLGWATVRQFRDAISTLRDSDFLCVNRVGNLSVLRGRMPVLQGYYQIGYIELANWYMDVPPSAELVLDVEKEKDHVEKEKDLGGGST